MKNQLKEFFNWKEYDEYFSNDGPNFSLFSLMLWLAATVAALTVLVMKVKQIG